MSKADANYPLRQPPSGTGSGTSAAAGLPHPQCARPTQSRPIRPRCRAPGQTHEVSRSSRKRVTACPLAATRLQNLERVSQSRRSRVGLTRFDVNLTRAARQVFCRTRQPCVGMCLGQIPTSGPDNVALCRLLWAADNNCQNERRTPSSTRRGGAMATGCPKYGDERTVPKAVALLRLVALNS